MHGIIFTSFRHFVTSRAGSDAAERVWANEPTYLITRSYPDEAFLRLFDTACRELGEDPDELLRAFGVFAGERTFVLLYPSYFAQASGPRPFLLGLEERIHELVRATVPEAAPPRLVIEPLDDDGVRVTYTSPRRLCVLLEGLLLGTARHFGREVAMEQTSCMHRGGDACVVEARFDPP
ncbi:MAG TPA: heme NO-binding domain-containing protein [Gaiellaceae bacterium]|nr:heme NO-binding domain-containing protein [Gaiellaceae bacterium]